MLTYNTHLKPLKFPEYGRTIQNMVDHCLTIEDRDERTRCAFTIVSSMQKLFPQQANTDQFKQKLWDHIAIMSDFKLDVDYPFEVITQENLAEKPEPMHLPQSKLRYRHYGQIIDQMIAKAVGMPEGEERTELELMIANQMKKQMLAVSTEGVDDERIFKDLYAMSDGRIRLYAPEVTLHEFSEAAQPGKKKRKRKK